MHKKISRHDLESRVQELEQEILKHKQNKNEFHAKMGYVLQHDDEIPDVELLDIIDLDYLQKIQDSFAHAMGVASIISDIEGTPITAPSNFCGVCEMVRNTAEGAKRCAQSDKILGQKAKETLKPVFEKCHSCGFVDASAPIIVGGKHIANWLIGQSNVMGVSRDEIQQYALEIGIDPDSLSNAYSNAHQMELGKFEQVLDLLWIMAKQFSALGYNNLKLKLDVQKRKSTEKKLIENKTHLQTLIRAIPDLVWLKDTHGVYLMCNSRFENFFGATEKEIVGKTDYDFVDEELANIFRKNDKIVMSTRGINTNEERVTFAKDGHHEILETTKTPMYTSDGNLTGVLGIGRDITSRKKDEKEKTNLEKKYHHAQKMEAIGQLAGGVAHDFNNMLSGIMGAAEILKLSPGLDEESLEFVDMILNSSKRAAELTAKLLAFGRKGNASSISINTNKVIEDSIALLNQTLDKKIVIELNHKAQNGTIEGDYSGLQNALINLGINASHAMPDGGTLSFGTRNIHLNQVYCNASPFEIGPGNFIEITIRDTGSGISPEDITNIFNPFFTTKEQGKGTGLGLSTVYGTIKNHHGAIYVYSEKGNGTTFNIYLPLSEDESTIQTNEPRLHESVHGTGKILLVDDEEIIRITGSMLLRKMGYEVITAQNGQEAVTVFKENPEEIDLVITDMIMPIMNGREVFYELRKIKKDCKIVLSSGFTKNENIEALKKDGLSGFINKPFSDIEISQLIYKVLHQSTPTT